MKSHDLLQLIAIVLAARNVQETIFDLPAEIFATNEQMRSAVIWQLIFIGTSVERLSKEFKTMVSEIRWNEFIEIKNGFMNNGGHYDTFEVFRYAQEAIPDIISIFSTIIKSFQESGIVNSIPAGAIR